MSSAEVTALLRECMSEAFQIAAPLLIAAFIGGIVIGLLQILTSIQDPGFGAVPRLGIMLVSFAISLPWMLSRMVSFLTRLYQDFGRYVH
jgi:flagellar biosynthesis protein FliQ